VLAPDGSQGQGESSFFDYDAKLNQVQKSMMHGSKFNEISEKSALDELSIASHRAAERFGKINNF
jgi:hypothetical protein